MKNKLIIIFTSLSLIVGIWIVKANTALFAPVTINKSYSKIKDNVKTKKHNYKKISHQLDQDEDGYTNYISVDNVLLSVYGGILKIRDINPTTAKSTFGNPVNETTEFSDVENANVIVYKYAAGEIRFLDNKLLSIEVLDEGFSFQFRRSDGSQIFLTSGSETDELYNTFTTSWENGIDKHVNVFIKAPSGIKTDASVIFGLVYDINDPNNNTIHTITLQN